MDSCTQLTFPNHPLKKNQKLSKEKKQKIYNLFRNNQELPNISKSSFEKTLFHYVLFENLTFSKSSTSKSWTKLILSQRGPHEFKPPTFLLLYYSLFFHSNLTKELNENTTFQKVLFNSFYETLGFLKKHIFIMHFLKTQLFQKA